MKNQAYRLENELIIGKNQAYRLKNEWFIDEKPNS